VNEPAEEELVIPDDIAGPFWRERRVTGRFRHAGAQVASVVYYHKGGYSVVTSQGADHSARPHRWARPTTVCEIVRGRHVTTFALQLPAAGAATFFETKVTLRWEVTDYQLVADKRLGSVERDLGPEIVDRLRAVSESFAVHEAQKANQAIRAQTSMGRWSDLGSEVGLRTWMFVDVGTDRAYREQVAGARVDDAEAQRVRARYARFQGLTSGTTADRIAYLMASGTQQDTAELIRMMRDEERQGRREARDLLMRLLEQDRFLSPELEAHLRDFLPPRQGGEPAARVGSRGTPPQLPPAAEAPDAHAWPGPHPRPDTGRTGAPTGVPDQDPTGPPRPGTQGTTYHVHRIGPGTAREDTAPEDTVLGDTVDEGPLLAEPEDDFWSPAEPGEPSGGATPDSVWGPR
jgi:hypothetical protein